MTKRPELTLEQEELLFRLVELDREARRLKQPRDLHVLRTNTSDILLMGPNELEIDYHDAVVLGERGFIRQTEVDVFQDGSGDLNGVVTPDAHAYYERRRSERQTPEILSEEVVRYVDTQLPVEFRKAAKVLAEAGTRIWTAQADTDLTEIGHKVREALQEFTDVLYKTHCPTSANEPIDKTKTRNKVAAFRGALEGKLGDSDKKMLRAIEAFCDAVGDLAQKLEHNSLRDDRPVELEDAKRLVLLAHVTMKELIRFAARVT